MTLACPGASFTGKWNTAEATARHFSLPGANSWAQDTNLAIERAIVQALADAYAAMDAAKLEDCAASTTCTCVPNFCVMLGDPRISTEAGQSLTFGPSGTVPLAPVAGTPSVGGGGQLSTGIITTIIIADIDWWLWTECICDTFFRKPKIADRPSGTTGPTTGTYAYGGTCTYFQGADTFELPCQSPWVQNGTVKTYEGHLAGTALDDAVAEVRAQAGADMAKALSSLAPCVPGCASHPPMLRMLPATHEPKHDDRGDYTIVLILWFVGRVCGDKKK